MKALSIKFLLVLGLLTAALLPAATLPAHALELTSPDVPAASTFRPQFVFNGFGCVGENQSPTLSWRGAPVDTKSFALTVYDPDAPTGSGWWHWLVIDIPASHTNLLRGFGKGDNARSALQLRAEKIRQIRNDYGKAAYGGPCPPAGDQPHRYIFTLYALKVAQLDIPDDASAALTGYMIRANAIDQASFTAYYNR
jgi:Raf kinase inhibitor-like YbhB/YbcL family protein